MKKWMYLLVLPLLVFCACNNEEEKKPVQSENDLDAARMLLRAVLDGRWKEAKTLIVQDDANLQYLDATEDRFTRLPADSVRNYRESQIHIYDTRHVNDSVSVITFSNTFTNQKDSVKAVKINGRWLVDLKFKLQNSSAK